MKTLYLDIFSGISGDMFIGALLDLGVDFHELERELGKLKLDGYHLHSARQKKSQIEGVKFDVHLAHGHDQDRKHNEAHEHEHTHADGTKHSHAHEHEEHHHGHEHEHSHDLHQHDHGHPPDHEHEHTHADGTKHSHSHPEHDEHEHEHGDDEHHHGRNFSEIKKLIADSSLSIWVKEKAIAIFQRIAVAEGKIHGMPPDQVHFHEVGAVDSIVDIVGACIAVELLGKPRILASNVVEGTGWINCAHGRFPIPAPATLSILGAREIAISQCDEPNELVTPTGAALLAELVESFGSMQNLVATRIGFGLGTRDHKTRPNVIRAILGEASGHAETQNDWQTDTISVLETNLDDTTGEILGHFIDKAVANGALDVFHTAIQMKKSRPGVLLTVLCAVADADKFSEMILRDTSAFGVRRSTLERRKLQRAFQTVKTGLGEVTVKLGKLNGKVIQSAPEFESCRKLAEEKKVPLKEIYEAVAQCLDQP